MIISNSPQELLRVLKNSSVLFGIDVLNISSKLSSTALEDYSDESFQTAIMNSPQEFLRVLKSASVLFEIGILDISFK